MFSAGLYMCMILGKRMHMPHIAWEDGIIKGLGHGMPTVDSARGKAQKKQPEVEPFQQLDSSIGWQCGERLQT